MAWLQTLGIVFVLLTGGAICLPALRRRAGQGDRGRALRLGLPLVLLAATAIVDGATPAARGKTWVVVAIYWFGLAWIGLQLTRALLDARR